MKKRGFTLLELLAVIVIIAVVALITIPMILNVIEEARKNSYKESAMGYVDAIEKKIVKEQLKNTNTDYTGEYSINKETITKKNENAALIPILDTISLKLKIKGTLPDKGNVEIDKKGVASGKFYYGDYLVTLNGEKYNVEIVTNGSTDSSDLKDRIDELEEQLKAERSSNTYSTEEQLIGTWIDGKKLYRQTFTYGAVAAGSWLTIGKIENMDNGFIDTSASYFVNANANMAATGARIPVVVSGRNVSAATYTVYTHVTSDGNIITAFGSTAKASSMVVTVMYTKKTD